MAISNSPEVMHMKLLRIKDNSQQKKMPFLK